LTLVLEERTISLMSLEDRDWYREEPSNAWKTRWDPSPMVPHGGAASGKAGIGVLAVAIVSLAVWHWHLLPLGAGGLAVKTPAAASPGNPVAPTSSDNVVRLRPDPRLDMPATRVSRWTFTDRRFGTLSIYVPVGETPRQAVTVALAARGYQVVP
jgi:hypothetical protein